MNTNKILLSVLNLIIVLNTKLFAQEPDTLWTKVIGGDSIDVAYDVEEVWNGGFAVVGYTKQNLTLNSGYDVWLIRTDPNGNILWTRTYGGDGDDFGYSIKKTNDGGFIIAGTTNSFGAGQFDFYIVRTDSIGDTLWTRTFGEMNNDYGWSVEPSIDGGFVVAGEINAFPLLPDGMVVKIDSNGQAQWVKIYSTLLGEKLYSIKQSNDGGFVTTGTLYLGNQDVAGWLLKISSEGDSIWTQLYGEIKQDLMFSVNKTLEGGYILTGGLLNPSTFYYNLWLIKVDSLGNEQWSKLFDYDNDSDIGYSVQQTTDGGYIITGQGRPYDGLGLMWIIKTDPLGNMLWDKTFPWEFPHTKISGPVSPLADVGTSVKQTSDGGYIVVGYRDDLTGPSYQAYLIRIASDIIPVELTSFTASVMRNSVSLNWQTATETNNSGFELQRSEMSNVKGQTDWQIVGFVPGFGTTTEPKSYSYVDENLSVGIYQYRLKQIDFDGTFEYSKVVEVEITSPTEFSLGQNYPNPFNPSTNIKYTISSRQFVTLKIFNSLGEEIETLVNEFQDAGVHSKLYIVNSTLPSGVYYYQLNAGGQALTSKMILLR